LLLDMSFDLTAKKIKSLKSKANKN